ncbi:MAG: cytidylate kinase-like family protein, partial [Bacteroidales bacterium]|nr:cytidylate kinase-like family protein [Bacteroidales bacterium]
MDSHLIITIGRQIGAGGLGVARLLSQEFGLKVYDKELLAAVARESGLDEACFQKRDEKSSRGVLGALQGFRSLFGMYNRTGTDTVMNEDKLFQIQSEVMRNIAAKEDCIIVGRCADYILRDEPRLMSVFISASL